MRQRMPLRAIKNALELRFVNVASVKYILGDGVEFRRPMNLRFRHHALLLPCSRATPEGISSSLGIARRTVSIQTLRMLSISLSGFWRRRTFVRVEETCRQNIRA